MMTRAQALGPQTATCQTSGDLADDSHIEIENLVVRYGDIIAVRGVSFSVRRGEHVTLLGPSGCGKTTILRSIAGLEQPAAGEIRIDGRPVYSASRRINIPTEKRGLSMVFQSYAIWPHMSVFDNVAYGLRVRKVGKQEIEEKVHWALALVGLGDFDRRSAAKLSGGQQQRVALARSIVFAPTVLLFDEPLSNLDARLRARMRIEIKELQRQIGITTVYVTHDLEEALAVSDRVIVMDAGVIVQSGSPGEIYNMPRTAFVADFVGAANLIQGRLRPNLARDDLIVLETLAGSLVYGESLGRATGEEVTFAVRTVFPTLSRAAPAEPLNVWPASIRRRVLLGDIIEYLIDWDGRQLVLRRLASELYDEGEQVYLRIEPQHCVLLEP
jgi:iron(III) transport system ATP-binding protein